MSMSVYFAHFFLWCRNKNHIRQLGRNLKRYYRACTSYATQQTAAHLSTTVQREVACLIIRHLHHIHARLEVAHLV